MDEKNPKMDKMGYPVWCHRHCCKMKVALIGLCKDILILQGSAAELVIIRKHASWLVLWRIIRSPEEQTMGQIIFDNCDLQSAFGISDQVGSFGQGLIDQYGATTARQGKFIRFREFLNIPCPGTGHDGDPNISIELTEEIRKAALDLVCRCR